MMRYFAKIRYLGTNFHGFQVQPEKRTVQSVLSNGLFQALGYPCKVTGCSRTDAGVHALEQCFSFKTNFSPNKLPLALNSKLPDDIKILWAKEVEPNFHARYSAHKKTYIYRLKTETIQSPFDYDTTAYIPYKLDLKKMQEAAKYFIGTHNFKAFCSAGTSVPTFEREIYSLKITRENNTCTFEICGNGFLYNMVRIIVGTLVDVGRGKLKPLDIEKILISTKRESAGKTMPAKGLFLKCVEY